MPPPDISVRGIRGPMPSGYVLGRQSAGNGPPELISLAALTTPLQNQVTSVFGRGGVIVAASGDYSVGQVTGAAPLDSPALTGNPTAPTPSPGDNDTSVATTAFVHAAVSLAAGGLPYLSVYLNAAQSFPSGGGVTQIQFDTVSVDSGSGWSAVNHRYTPLTAGRYLVSAGFNIIAGANCSAGGYLGLIQLRKNGAVYRKWATQAIAAKAGLATSASGNIVVEIQMNGSTDYIDVAGYSEDSAPSFSGVAVGIQTYLEIHYIGP